MYLQTKEDGGVLVAVKYSTKKALHLHGVIRMDCSSNASSAIRTRSLSTYTHKGSGIEQLDGAGFRRSIQMKLPRFTQVRELADGTKAYRFNPPQKFITAGVVERVELGPDLSAARSAAREYNAKIDEWRKSQAEILDVRKGSKLSLLVRDYCNSSNFTLLRKSTQKDYMYFLNSMVQTLEDARISDVTTRRAKGAYEKWIHSGIPYANHVCAAASILYNYAIDREYVTFNPFAYVKRKTPMQRKVVWQHEHVVKFLDTAYSEWRWRNIGLIAQMTYEWVQRLGDMRVLEWDSIDLDAKRLDLQQSKRRGQVSLPISNELINMLTQQHEDFGFQKYVAPMIAPVQGEFIPYTKQRLSKLSRQVIIAAELPSELWLMDLRRTGTTQMNDAGVSMGQIMSVTGHVNPQSVKPYLTHTYASANSALTQRQSYGKSIEPCRMKGDT